MRGWGRGREASGLYSHRGTSRAVFLYPSPVTARVKRAINRNGLPRRANRGPKVGTRNSSAALQIYLRPRLLACARRICSCSVHIATSGPSILVRHVLLLHRVDAVGCDGSAADTKTLIACSHPGERTHARYGTRLTPTNSVQLSPSSPTPNTMHDPSAFSSPE
ncbi:hypothetical protein K474DRAFT_383189 [Panus rudis PR-1116 ss-1]|nr:hypothetical protein K474DRAFT_383189 [Panus rudis PR-1116 ss-1]